MNPQHSKEKILTSSNELHPFVCACSALKTHEECPRMKHVQYFLSQYLDLHALRAVEAYKKELGERVEKMPYRNRAPQENVAEYHKRKYGYLSAMDDIITLIKEM